MANYLDVARRYARKYGIDPNYFGNQMTQEAHGQDLTSPAGAQGPAQIMPATARAWGVKNPHDINQAYNAAARADAQYLKNYGGDWAKVLTAYNAGPGAVGHSLPAETQAYIKKILGGNNSRVSAPTGMPSLDTTGASGGDESGVAALQAQLASAQRQQAIGATLHSDLLERGNQLNKQLGYGLQVNQGDAPDNSQDVNNLEASIRAMQAQQSAPQATPDSSTDLSTADTSSMANLGHGRVTIAPGAMKPGTKLQGVVTSFLNQLSAVGRRPITVGTGTNHSYLTVNGNVSDHTTGNAADIPVPIDSSLGDRTAMRALELAGVPPDRAAQMARQGGLYTLTPSSGPYKGRRIQIIWKTNEGGNHHNHVHVGIK